MKNIFTPEELKRKLPQTGEPVNKLIMLAMAELNKDEKLKEKLRNGEWKEYQNINPYDIPDKFRDYQEAEDSKGLQRFIASVIKGSQLKSNKPTQTLVDKVRYDYLEYAITADLNERNRPLNEWEFADLRELRSYLPRFGPVTKFYCTSLNLQLEFRDEIPLNSD